MRAADFDLACRGSGGVHRESHDFTGRRVLAHICQDIDIVRVK